MTEKDIILAPAITRKDTYFLFRGDFEQITIKVIDDTWWADKILTLKERLKVNKTVLNDTRKDSSLRNKYSNHAALCRAVEQDTLLQQGSEKQGKPIPEYAFETGEVF